MYTAFATSPRLEKGHTQPIGSEQKPPSGVDTNKEHDEKQSTYGKKGAIQILDVRQEPRRDGDPGPVGLFAANDRYRLGGVCANETDRILIPVTHNTACQRDLRAVACDLIDRIDPVHIGHDDGKKPGHRGQFQDTEN
jgi:hypothetical protein